LKKNIVAKPSIRPDIRYPASGLAGYPAKTVSGASLIIIHFYNTINSSPSGIFHVCVWTLEHKGQEKGN
jgi:hypothetical protein